MEKEPKPSTTPIKKTSEAYDELKKEPKPGMDQKNVTMWITAICTSLTVVCTILVVILNYQKVILDHQMFKLDSKKTSHQVNKSDQEQFNKSLAAIRYSNENVRLSPITCTPVTAKFASMSDQLRYEILSYCTDCMRIDKRSNVGTAPELLEISLQFLNLGNYEECEYTIKLARERNQNKFIEFECQELLIRLHATRGEFEKANKIFYDAEQNLMKGDSLSSGECQVRRLRLMRCKAMAEYIQNPNATKPSKTLLSAIKMSEKIVPLPDVYQIQGYLYALRSLYPEDATYAIKEAPSPNSVKTLKPINFKELAPRVKNAPAPQSGGPN